jgi:hypothetical protein
MDGLELVADFGTYLNVQAGQFDETRAVLILNLAIARCSAIITPLPDAATGVVFDVAQRAYSNVTGVSSEGVGPFSRSVPSIGVSLTSANRRELRQLAGRGGAFTIDPTPADAGAGLNPWDLNQTWLNGQPELEEPRG